MMLRAITAILCCTFPLTGSINAQTVQEAFFAKVAALRWQAVSAELEAGNLPDEQWLLQGGWNRGPIQDEQNTGCIAFVQENRESVEASLGGKINLFRCQEVSRLSFTPSTEIRLNSDLLRALMEKGEVSLSGPTTLSVIVYKRTDVSKQENEWELVTFAEEIKIGFDGSLKEATVALVFKR